jgi:cytochrome oxidase assembly protein ShyY1
MEEMAKIKEELRVVRKEARVLFRMLLAVLMLVVIPQLLSLGTWLFTRSAPSEL